MLLEEVIVSLISVKNFMMDWEFLLGIENCLISGGRILMDEFVKKDLIEGVRLGNRNSLGDRGDVNMVRED